MQKVIAVDLDGTLAHYDGWKDYKHIGLPIQPMVDKVREWVLEGHKVVLFTSRDLDPHRKNVIEDWLRIHEIPIDEITRTKRKEFTEFWDDRAVRVHRNIGHASDQFEFRTRTLDDSNDSESGVESAMDVQVGGAHYKKYKIQPFTFVRANGIPAAEADIIGYVMRHKDKNGKEDLLKARHLIDMILESDYE